MIFRWHEFFHRPADPRIPALIRIVFSLLLLINLASLYPNLEKWFGESGVFPSELYRQTASQFQWSVLNWLPPGETTLHACFWIFVLQTLCLLLGVASRFSAISVFIWLTSFQHRNPMIWDAEDKVFRLISFFLIFMPLAEVWSLDARLPRPAWLESFRVKSPWALRLLQYQMCLIMFATALCKIFGETWRDGTALYYVARIDDLFGRFPIPHYLFDTPWTVRAMTWLVLVAEFGIPFLIWLKDGRRFCLLVLLAFHLSNEYTMQLFLFHWIMLCGWISFLTADDLDALANGFHLFRTARGQRKLARKVG